MPAGISAAASFGPRARIVVMVAAVFAAGVTTTVPAGADACA